jgi:transposase-like protein
MKASSAAMTIGSGTASGDALPPIETTRWVARRKAAIVTAVADGVLDRSEACRRYGISDAELRLWEHAIACAGVPGLRVTRVQIYRPIFEAGNNR